MMLHDLERSFKAYALYEKGMAVKTYHSIWGSFKMLTNFAKTQNLAHLDTSIIKNFLYTGKIEKGWRTQTFRNYWQYFKIFFDWCKKEGWLKKNPVVDIEKPKLDKLLPRCISTEDAKKIQYHTACYPWKFALEKYRNEAIINLLMMTGIRLQEMLNLEYTDVNLTSGDILIRQGKGKKDRWVPIHPRLLPILRAYVEKKQTGPVTRWFFAGIRSGKQLQQKDIRRICKKVGIAANVKFSPHVLRHTFAREMIDNDFNLYKLKGIMGHADITTTQRYLSISTQGIKDSLSQVKIF